MSASRATPWCGRTAGRGPRRWPTRLRMKSSPPSRPPRGPSSSPVRRCRTSAAAHCWRGSKPRPAAPAVIMESPRGIADATLGAFSDLVQARRPDRAARQGARLHHAMGHGPGVRSGGAADRDRSGRRRWSSAPRRKWTAAYDRQHRRQRRRRRDADRSRRREKTRDGGLAQRSARRARQPPGRVAQHRVANAGPSASRTGVPRAAPFVERDPDTVLICDGGEFAQWGQSMLPVRRRMINGVAGSIGGALSFAIAARLRRAEGAGVRGARRRHHRLPHCRIRDRGAARSCRSSRCSATTRGGTPKAKSSCREYGAQAHARLRALPARYDRVVAALGGHGEHVERAEDLPGAIERALASGKPACINVMIESIAAPAIRLNA